MATNRLSVECEGAAGYDSALALDPFSSLQRSVFMSGRAFSYFADTPGLPLSLKCMSNGRALYKFDRAELGGEEILLIFRTDPEFRKSPVGGRFERQEIVFARDRIS